MSCCVWSADWLGITWFDMGTTPFLEHAGTNAKGIETSGYQLHDQARCCTSYSKSCGSPFREAHNECREDKSRPQTNCDEQNPLRTKSVASPSMVAFIPFVHPRWAGISADPFRHHVGCHATRNRKGVAGPGKPMIACLKLRSRSAICKLYPVSKKYWVVSSGFRRPRQMTLQIRPPSLSDSHPAAVPVSRALHKVQSVRNACALPALIAKAVLQLRVLVPGKLLTRRSPVNTAGSLAII